MKASDYLKKFEAAQGKDTEKPKEHTLRENALERAMHLSPPKAGTPYDWEDYERYKKELEEAERKKQD